VPGVGGAFGYNGVCLGWEGHLDTIVCAWGGRGI